MSEQIPTHEEHMEKFRERARAMREVEEAAELQRVEADWRQEQAELERRRYWSRVEFAAVAIFAAGQSQGGGIISTPQDYREAVISAERLIQEVDRRRQQQQQPQQAPRLAHAIECLISDVEQEESLGQPISKDALHNRLIELRKLLPQQADTESESESNLMALTIAMSQIADLFRGGWSPNEMADQIARILRGLGYKVQYP